MKFKIIKRIFVGLILSVSCVMNIASAGLITYTDRAAWESALLGYQILEEDFTGSASGFGANSSNNVVNDFTIDIIGHDGDSSRQGLTGDGFFAGEVDSSDVVSDDGAIIQFNYSTFAFALNNLQNDSDTSAEFNVHEISIEILNEYFLLSDLLGLTTGLEESAADSTVSFIGFISTELFTNFRLYHGDSVRTVSGSTESFWLDGISYVETPVPEPSTIAIFALGLRGLASRRFKKQR